MSVSSVPITAMIFSRLLIIVELCCPTFSILGSPNVTLEKGIFMLFTTDDLLNLKNNKDVTTDKQLHI
jgi:hypothetical protein